jgi:dTDP-4-dehydrorhamnose 3,5-epimerase
VNTNLTGIDGLWRFTPRVFADSRGSFLEWFRSDEVSRCLGYQPDIVQANCQVSRRGVVRGVHFTEAPPGQAKYVACVTGAILDVVVDVRVGSPSYGQWQAARLDDENRVAMFITEGLGHAYLALTEAATVMYLATAAYAPGREHGIHPLDPEIGIDWPDPEKLILSDRDAAAPTLEQARKEGLLPGYAAVQAYRTRLSRP